MADQSACFKDVPELFEVELGEAIAARTERLATFRELGPPDLVHVVKSTGRVGALDLGSYHYITGVDASSSASLAAYINKLTYAIEDNAGWFSKSSAWKVRNGCYCCFNAFSRLDMRVDVKIPGGVNAYVVDVRGERHDATPELWLETYISAIIRAIIYADDPTYWTDAYRKLDPITTVDGELRFLQAAEALFMKGWQVGSDPEIQVASITSNHLVEAIMKYFGDSGRYQQAANLFEKLYAKEPEVASLLARSYIGMNEEVKAVQIMAAAMRQTPQSYTLLHAQCDFLRSKSKHEWAVKLARQAVNCAPSEFVTWEKLSELYIDSGQFESALLTLNSCPMFTFSGRDMHRNLTPARVHLPFDRSIGDVLPDKQKTEEDEADPALQRLPAPGLRGTWARAYALLTRLVSQIGWDELLKARSAVFVMEEEYRMQKAQTDIQQHMSMTNGDDSAADSHEGVDLGTREELDEADDDASIRAMTSSTHVPTSTVESVAVPGVPKIVISPDVDKEVTETESATQPPQEKREEEEVAPKGEDKKITKENGVNNVATVEMPEQSAIRDDDQDPPPISAHGQDAFSFSNKRLCERWLDNLFMVLYEDLRVWTIFRAEVAHFKTQHVAYRKTALEWEILGDLGLRLHHKEDAKEAYQRCLESTRYSIKPWEKLMNTYADEGDIQRCIQTAIRVAAYQYAEYAEMTYPTSIAKCFFKLGRIHGHAKIQFTLLSMGLPEAVLKIMDSYLASGRVFKVEGWDF